MNCSDNQEYYLDMPMSCACNCHVESKLNTACYFCFMEHYKNNDTLGVSHLFKPLWDKIHTLEKEIEMLNKLHNSQTRINAIIESQLDDIHEYLSED